MTEKELLDWLNKIIQHIDNGYVWRELSEFDLELRKHFNNE